MRDGDRHPEARPVTFDPANPQQPAEGPPAAVDLVQPVPAFPPRFPDHPAPGDAGPAGALPSDSTGGALTDPLGVGRRGQGSRLPVWLAATAVLVVGMGLVLWSTRAWVESQRTSVTTASPVPPVPEVPLDDGGLVAAPSDPPDDAEWSRAQIRAALGIAFDAQSDPAAWSAAVDAPGITVEQMKALSARCGPVVPAVDTIDFTSRDDAFLRFRLVGSRVPGADTVVLTGGAVRRDGVWKVTGFTLDAVAGIAGSSCT